MPNSTNTNRAQESSNSDEGFQEVVEIQKNINHKAQAVLRYLLEVSPKLIISEKATNDDLFNALLSECNIPNSTGTPAGDHIRYAIFFNIIITYMEIGFVEYSALVEFSNGMKTELPKSINRYGALNESVRKLVFNAEAMAQWLVPPADQEENNDDGFALHHVIFSLTPKGYDVALTYRTHEDEKHRFEQQRAIAQTSSEAAHSSAKTARRALIAAGFIAFGSIGGLAITIWPELKDAIRGSLSALTCYL